MQTENIDNDKMSERKIHFFFFMFVVGTQVVVSLNTNPLHVQNNSLPI